MGRVIFLSHAGLDSTAAGAIATDLEAAGLKVRLDRRELRAGDSILSYMEDALSSSDHCLLLWSRNAAKADWVREEWQAALHRSVSERRSFLAVGRLEDVPPPSLLSAHLWIDLFPDRGPGLRAMVDMWSNGQRVTAPPGRDGSACEQAPAHGYTTLYVSSEAFGFTLPVGVSLEQPAGVCLDAVIAEARLPQSSAMATTGVRFSYRLMKGDVDLDRSRSLASQGVAPQSTLWLETTLTPFSPTQPLGSASLDPIRFRGR
jgi:hypothetical protein